MRQPGGPPRCLGLERRWPATEFFLHGGLETGSVGGTDDEAWQVHWKNKSSGFYASMRLGQRPLARKHGIPEATLYNWKAKYGGMDVSEAKRLRMLEDENRS
jgi:hypothetical protein